MIDYICIDYETKDSRGASFEYYRNDFRIFSLSCCWRDPKTREPKFWFSTDPMRIAQKLASMARTQVPVIAHNLGYEMGCTKKVYKHIELNWHADTMRLTQLRDGGGDLYDAPVLTLEQEIAMELGEMNEKQVKRQWAKTKGLGLEAAAFRYLSEKYQGHKKPAHDWLEENLGIKKDHGRHLDRLPYDMLEQYNNGDTLITLLLYESHVKFFEENKYDWAQDCKLYFNRAKLMTGAHIKGIKFNSEKALDYIVEIEAEIKAMEDEFEAMFAKEIEIVKENRLVHLWNHWTQLPKTERGKANRCKKLESGQLDDEWNKFNVGSSKQLAELLTGVLGMEAQFETPKGSPSFKASHLQQWGKGGLILQKRKKRLLVLNQAANAYLASLHDGRVHPSIKISGTRTNRVAGGRD